MRTKKTKDSYVWGEEEILWGFKPEHKYTYKLLKPKKGRLGCLSLQYHRHKSETWLVISGRIWAMVIGKDNQITTLQYGPGAHVNLEAGVVHRLMAMTDDTVVAEASTPDRHAADKSVKKDVIRLHCVHGRKCSKTKRLPKDKLEAAIQITEEAIQSIESKDKGTTLWKKLLRLMTWR